jgi:hypothetical protein
MLIVCHETAEQKARARAEKEGEMKELLEQYNRIQGLAIGLRHINQDLPGFVADEAVEVMINKINLKMHTLAHEIVRELQQQLDDSTKQLDEPESAAGGYKPLWAVVPVDGPDDAWRTVDKHYGGLRYRVFLNKEKAEEHRGNFGKVVPVWGGMKVSKQIEQLKAEIAALEAAQIVMRKHGCGISKYIEQTVVVIQETINELEKQADDPWKEAKQLIGYWGRDDLMLDNNGRLLQQVALYVRHLELKAKELEASDADQA